MLKALCVFALGFLIGSVFYLSNHFVSFGGGRSAAHISKTRNGSTENRGFTRITAHEEIEITGRRCNEVSFSEVNLPMTALASFPGSGNTWIRNIIQLVSGVYTGSVYYDPGLIKKGFKGEGLNDASVVAVKTHYPLFNCCDPLKYEKVVLVIRDPEEAIRSSFILTVTHYNHTGQINDSQINPKTWKEYSANKAKEWIFMNSFWFNYTKDHNMPMFILFYKDLIAEFSLTVKRLSSFIGVELTEEDLLCIKKYNEGQFHRKYENNQFDQLSANKKIWKPNVKVIDSEIHQCVQSEQCLTSGSQGLRP